MQVLEFQQVVGRRVYLYKLYCNHQVIYIEQTRCTISLQIYECGYDRDKQTEIGT